MSWIDGAKAKESNEMLSQPHASFLIRLAVECRIEFKLSMISFERKAYRYVTESII
uniref:hypothetical protein n=1 Tax=Trichocoleus desertorum TaxID=1481672 RepID=UPI0025B486F6|nr:hypothetical protein [Trichocoleus desertorum]